MCRSDWLRVRNVGACRRVECVLVYTKVISSFSSTKTSTKSVGKHIAYIRVVFTICDKCTIRVWIKPTTTCFGIIVHLPQIRHLCQILIASVDPKVIFDTKWWSYLRSTCATALISPYLWSLMFLTSSSIKHTSFVSSFVQRNISGRSSVHVVVVCEISFARTVIRL